MKTFWDIVNLLAFAACAIVGLHAASNGEWSKATTFYALCILVRKAV